MDRLGLPAEGIYDLSLLFTVTDEDFTSDFDTVVELDNKPIESGSESVETTNGVTKYVINTDYTMDYSNGTITGNIFEDPKKRFMDGTLVTTSNVKYIDKQNNVAQTRNTLYRLGTPAQD